jgi:N-acetylmuramoyl-L-alanine amidase
MSVLLLTLLAAFALPASGEGKAEILVTVDSSGPSTRLVVTKVGTVLHAVTEFEGKVEIVFADPVDVKPPDRQINGPILQGWSVEEGHRLVLRTGPGYRNYETFELRNPARLILDMIGTREGAGAAVRSGEKSRADRTVVVIDPGHGGKERGAVGPTGLMEKDVTLALARKLRTQLQKDPTVNVVLTRDQDRFVPLDERTAIANHNRADLFISIHLNASRRSSAFGAETYFLSAEATDDEARLLAGLENSADDEHEQLRAGMPDYEERGLDLILWDLAQNQYLAESSALAEAVQREMNQLIGTRDRGVRQAPFRVLMGATMPAILVEVGFVTNSDEERMLKQEGYLDRIVHALTRAVQEFLLGLDTYQPPPARDR